MATEATHTTLISSELFLGPKSSLFVTRLCTEYDLTMKIKVSANKMAFSEALWSLEADIVAVCDSFTQLSTQQDST